MGLGKDLMIKGGLLMIAGFSILSAIFGLLFLGFVIYIAMMFVGV